MSERIKVFFVFIIALIAIVAMIVYQQVNNQEISVDEDYVYNNVFLKDIDYLKENIIIEYELVHKDFYSVVNKSKYIVIKKEKYYYLNDATQQKMVVIKKESIEKIKHYAVNSDLEVIFDKGVLYKNCIWYNSGTKLFNNEENIDYANRAMTLADYSEL